MNKIIKHISLFIILFFVINSASAQLDAIMKTCEKYLTDEYISDGQQYISLISGEQIAEFNVIFYGGNTYRIISNGNNKQQLNFVVYDKNRNELFNNSNFNNTSYWDIQFESTIECFIEAKLVNGENNSGFAVLLIGLKK